MRMSPNESRAVSRTPHSPCGKLVCMADNKILIETISESVK